MRIVAETIVKGQFKKIGEFEIPDSQFSELLGTFKHRSRYELAMKLAEERFPSADIRNVTIHEEVSGMSGIPTSRIRRVLNIRTTDILEDFNSANKDRPDSFIIEKLQFHKRNLTEQLRLNAPREVTGVIEFLIVGYEYVCEKRGIDWSKFI